MYFKRLEIKLRVLKLMVTRSALSLRLKRPGREADQSAHQVPTFKMRGPTSALPHVSSRRAHGDCTALLCVTVGKERCGPNGAT